MTIVTNTFLTYSAVGNREDLSDTIYNISPRETPFMSSISRAKASAITHEWQTDALAAATATNAQLEGDDTSFSSVTATVRLSNTLQISRKDVIVSGTQEEVNKAGRKSEFSYQVAKKGLELRRDMETVMCGNFTQVPASSSGATTARVMRPLCAWITTNDNRNGSSVTGVDGSSTQWATDGTQRAFTESQVQTVLQACWTQGGNPDMIMTGAFNKTRFSTFTGNATRMDRSEDRKVIATTDVYVSDFGEHKIVANRFSRSRDVFVLDTEYWGVAFLRPFKTEDLAKTGDAQKKHIIVEYTLESRNEAASGVIADLTTS